MSALKTRFIDGRNVMFKDSESEPPTMRRFHDLITEENVGWREATMGKHGLDISKVHSRRSAVD